MKYAALFISGILIGGIAVSVFFQKKPEIWIPALEETSFNYMNNAINKVIKDIETAEKELKENHRAGLTRSLNSTMDEVLKLQLYYIPMTNVRQLIYDSEELFLLNKNKEALKNLAKAKDIMEKVGKPANELYTIVDDLMLAIKEKADTVKEKYSYAGRKSNLLLLKGGLVIKNNLLIEK